MSIKQDKDIIVIDNDECIGNFATASLMYTIFINSIFINNKKPIRSKTHQEYFCDLVLPYIDVYVSYLEKGAARPYLKEMIQKIYQLKLEGKIKKVIMYTAASDQYGWVTFLSKLIPTYAGVPLDLYDIILTQKDTTNTYGNYIKSLLKVSLDTSKIIMIDDTPENILKFDGQIIQVSKYKQYVNLLDHNFMDYIEPSYYSTALNAIEMDDKNYPKSNVDYSEDIELLTITNKLDDLFI